jgi:sugar lactone lactonase YvrE
MRCSSSPRFPRALAAALAWTFLAGGLGACATAPRKQQDVVWPLPPEKPRVKFVRAFSREDDLRTGAAAVALRIFVPTPKDVVVAQPTGLALTPDEKQLFIACASAGRVLRTDLESRSMSLFATEEGKSPGRPFSVAVDGAGNVFVSDIGLNAIWVYDSKGGLLKKLQSEFIDRPTGLAIDRRRQLLYAVSGVSGKSQAHRVEVFSLAGEHLRTIGKRGSAPGEFNFPTNVAVAPDGTLYVVDMLNFRVQVFDGDGQLLGMFGQIGAGQPGTFDKAKALALDAFGNIYVTDSQQGFVQIFNPRYQSLMAFAGRGQAPGLMLLPNAIAIDSKNTIYVADFAAGLVDVYQLINTSAQDSFAPEPGAPTSPAAPAPAPAAPNGGAGGAPGENPQNG